MSCADASELRALLVSIKLVHLHDLLVQEEVSVELLAELSHEELKALGIARLGTRHKLVKAAVAVLAAKRAKWDQMQRDIDKELGLSVLQLEADGWMPDPPPCPFASSGAFTGAFDADPDVKYTRQLIEQRDCGSCRRLYRRVALKYHPDKVRSTRAWSGCTRTIAQPAMAVFNQQYDDACRKKS